MFDKNYLGHELTDIAVGGIRKLITPEGLPNVYANLIKCKKCYTEMAFCQYKNYTYYGEVIYHDHYFHLLKNINSYNNKYIKSDLSCNEVIIKKLIE